VSADFELDAWRREWSVDTEPLPELERRFRAQNRRLLVGALAIAGCLAIGTVIAIRHPWDSGWGGFALGLWASSLAGIGYALWVRRGTWEPASETTGAYLDLLHRRAVAQLRKLVFLRRCLLVVLVAYTAVLLWKGWRFDVRSALLVAAFALEAWWMRRLERRRRRDVEDAAALARRMRQDDEGPLEERIEG
jgi:hypothetical protein